MVVPTLDLLSQTVQAWHDAGHTGPTVAVCSLQDDPELWNLRVRCGAVRMRGEGSRVTLALLRPVILRQSARVPVGVRR